MYTSGNKSGKPWDRVGMLSSSTPVNALLKSPAFVDVSSMRPATRLRVEPLPWIHRPENSTSSQHSDFNL